MASGSNALDRTGGMMESNSKIPLFLRIFLAMSAIVTSRHKNSRQHRNFCPSQVRISAFTLL
jgi:hypothetical protein